MNKSYKAFADLSFSGSILIAVMGLVSYLPGFRLLGSFSPSYIPMAPATSFSFIILGMLMLRLTCSSSDQIKGKICWTGIFLVAIFAILEMTGHLIGTSLTLEEKLIPTAGTLNGIPVARMAPSTAAVFFIASVASALFMRRRTAQSTSRLQEYLLGSLNTIVLLISFIFTLAYLYGEPLLYQQNTIPMALTTALGFMFFSLGLMVSGMESFPVSLLSGSSTRSYLLRFILPFSTMSVMLTGLITIYSEKSIHINPALLSAVLTVLTIFVSGSVATVIAQHMGSEIDRSKAEVKKSNDLLKASEEKFRTTLNSIGDAVIATDKNGRVTQMNPIGENLTGWKLSETEGRHISEVFNIINARTRKPAKIPIDEVLEKGEILGLANHTVLIARDGSEYQIADSAAPIKGPDGEVIGVVMVFRDVTEEYRTQEELHKMQRLHSIGTLAGGIAHDFNNILMGVYGNISLAREEITPTSPAHRLLEEAEKSMARATYLTRQLLTFARGGDPVKEVVSLGKLVEEVVNFDLSGSKVMPVVEYPSDLQLADADRGQLQQVFSNLAINAKEAMHEGGHLYISLTNTTVEQGQITNLAPGRYIKATVRDEGTGIPPEYRDQIFDPYFSTKKTGSGLGLATTYSIIKRHGGHISLDSQLNVGTTFNIYLPVATTTAPENAVVEQTPALIPAAGPRQARILVMDDEEAIRRIAAMALEKIGYAVETASGGSQAITMYSEAIATGRAFDAVIMDLTIPGDMGGKEAVQEILKIDPRAVVIVSSGYAEDPVMSNYAGYGFKGIVAKPYNISALRDALKEVLKS